ncbi:diguanylate cyclase [bacterium]|nr:MAG: diguanylate cyclase [bacterium]
MASSGESYRWFRQQTHPHHDDGGQVLYWISDLTDVEEERAAAAALTEARRFIARFGEATPDLMFLFDLVTGGTIYCSEASTVILGYTPAEMCAMGPALLTTLVCPEDWPTIAAELARNSENPVAVQEGTTAEWRAIRKDGEIVWLSTRSLVFERDEHGQPKVMLGISQDVTLRRLAEIEREDHTRILEHALSGVSVLDEQGRYVYANSEYAVLMGRGIGELVGQDWSLGLHTDDLSHLREEYERMAATARDEARRVESECRGVRPDGTLVHQHVVLVPKYREDRFVGHYRFVRDVTERVKFQHQLEAQLAHISSMSAELAHRSDELERANAILSRQAASDGLTGLANHRVFQETMAALNDAAQPHSLLLFDVDHFKMYNDEFGHPAGDVVLCTFARLLSEAAAGDELAARYGGEEFAMILPDIGLEEAEERARGILHRLTEIAWPHRAITASVGGAVWVPGRSRAELIEAADRALYVSKRNGRNRVTAAV